MTTRSSQRFDTRKIVQYCSTLLEPEALPKQGRTCQAEQFPTGVGLRACSTPLKISEAEIPPDQPQEMDCAALNSERTRLLAERADLKSPLLSSKTDAQRKAELTRVNGKLYTVAKVQSDKSCPAVASEPAGSVVR